MDPEFQILADTSTKLVAKHSSDDATWSGSPFEWIRSRPSRQKGAIGEKLIADWLTARGFTVARAGDSEADRVVEKKRVEIKFSTLWKNGTYTFQQLRDQRYDLAICLGVSPFDAHCWVLEKATILREWRETHNLKSQHRGSSGSDTAWLTVNPRDVQAWLRPHGGSLRDGLAIVARLTGFTPKDPRLE